MATTGDSLLGNIALKFNFSFQFYIVTTLLLSRVTSIYGRIDRPRGVALSKVSFYSPGRDFACLDGSATIPFNQVNDDYCDCKDGTDEPGTAACPSGHFHCTNAGYVPKNLPSSWVNDGRCDCCDGTDEYDGQVTCNNSCKEMGKSMREEQERQRKLLEEGYKIRQEYSLAGKKAKQDKKANLGPLQTDKDELEKKREELEKIKEDAEVPEKEAKDKHQKAWDEEKEKLKAAKELAKGEQAFKELDTNGDNVVSAEELMTHEELDKDSDGAVSLEEAKEYLEDNDQLDQTAFVVKVWPNIKEIYKKLESQQEGEQEPSEEAHPSTDDMKDALEPNPVEDNEEMPDDEDAGEDEEPKDPEEETKENGDQMPEYDEETKKVIESADQARNDYNDADSKFRDVEKQLNDINNFLGMDLGQEEEFFPLKDNCYEYTDREYTYKLCPFDRASQRSKDGGSETSLGTWGHWAGGDENKYAKMKYEHGQNCWNGPDRSATVIIKCGAENALLSASEPSRCEYHFDFTTPAACVQTLQPQQNEEHDEL